MVAGAHGMGTELIDQYAWALVGAKALVGSLTPEDLDKPTKCEGWDVRALVTHMIETNRRFAAALAGEPAAPLTPSDDALIAAYTQSADEALVAWRQPGALGCTVTLPPARQWSGAMALSAVFTDQLIHTWDLGKALGRGGQLPDDLAAAALEASRVRITPDQRGPGKSYAVEVPVAADTPVQDRLAGFLGRQP
jgi:uncharacterized protein (TIGR03086 family)